MMSGPPRNVWSCCRDRALIESDSWTDTPAEKIKAIYIGR